MEAWSSWFSTPLSSQSTPFSALVSSSLSSFMGLYCLVFFMGSVMRIDVVRRTGSHSSWGVSGPGSRRFISTWCSLFSPLLWGVSQLFFLLLFYGRITLLLAR
ncbi:hypothetical protein BD769DRAFT_1495737 [Suillus cothurnatus]|nr:hypothetical protein BD769DRAFT_1495737 [Suillus cothurnatus]